MAKQSVPQGKYYRDTPRMRNLIRTLKQTRSHTVRLETLKELYRECQKRANRGSYWAKQAKQAMGQAARKAAVKTGRAIKGGSSWTFRKVEDGASRGRARVADMRGNRRDAKNTRNQLKTAQRAEQIRTGPGGSTAGPQPRTPKLTSRPAPAAPGNGTPAPAAPGLSPQQKGARTRAANQAAKAGQAPASPAAPVPGRTPKLQGLRAGAPVARAAKPAVPMPGDSVQAPVTRSRGPAPSSPSGVASKPSVRKRTK